MVKVVCIVQARMGSTRLPEKVLMSLSGKPMLVHIIERLKLAETLDSIVIATTSLMQDDPVAELARREGVLCFRGSEDDVLSRYIGGAEMAGADVIVRITGDCPLIDPETVDNVVRCFLKHDYDYVSLTSAEGFIRGLDTEVFSMQALKKADELAKDKPSREHVTLYIYRHEEDFRVAAYRAGQELCHPDWRLCVDEEDDFKLIEKIYDRLYKPGSIIDIRDVVELLENEHELLEINAHVRQKNV